MILQEKNTISFEDAMKELEQIASQLEKGDLNLDQSVTKFEEGMKLSKTCNKILEDPQKRRSSLIKTADDVTEENFNAE